jgi:hypothetical protein
MRNDKTDKCGSRTVCEIMKEEKTVRTEHEFRRAPIIGLLAVLCFIAFDQWTRWYTAQPVTVSTPVQGETEGTHIAAKDADCEWMYWKAQKYAIASEQALSGSIGSSLAMRSMAYTRLYSICKERAQ